MASRPLYTLFFNRNTLFSLYNLFMESGCSSCVFFYSLFAVPFTFFHFYPALVLSRVFLVNSAPFFLSSISIVDRG